MPMHLKKSRRTVISVVGYTCDKCACKHEVDDGIGIDWDDVLRKNIQGGFGSPWGDGFIGDVVLCPECTFDLLQPYVRPTND